MIYPWGKGADCGGICLCGALAAPLGDARREKMPHGRCGSCNVCTFVCHQGIDVMNFANKGAAMNAPPVCALLGCVQSSSTGVLSFGRVDGKRGAVLGEGPDWLAASPVQMAELRVNGKTLKGKR